MGEYVNHIFRSEGVSFSYMNMRSNEQIFGLPLHVSVSEYMPRDPTKIQERIQKPIPLSLPKNESYGSLGDKKIAREMSYEDIFRLKQNDFEKRVHWWMSEECSTLRSWYGLTLEKLISQLLINHENTPQGIPSAAVAHMQGVRPSQEDTHTWGSVQLGLSSFPLYALCDGHSGPYASLFLKNHLLDIVNGVFQKMFPDGHIPYGLAGDIALENGLMMVGVMAEEALAKDRRLHWSRNAALELSGGTTLMFAIVIKGHVWVANIGDSRVLAIDMNGTHQLTTDASVNDPYFRRGVEQRGGHVEFDAQDQIYRADGLAVARSIGDCIPGISARAHVTKYRIPPGGVTLVLGCDGLFDSMSSADVGLIVEKGKGVPPSDVASLLIQSAFADGSQDNISAEIVRIRDKEEV